MSFYNGILNHDDNHESSQVGQRGLPGVGFKLDANGDYDIENKKLTNVKNGDMDHDVMVKSQIEGYVNNNFLNRLTGGEIGGDLDMRGHSIKYLKYDTDDSAAARVAELNSKADKSDLDDYFKLDGTKAMTGNLDMRGHSIKYLKYDTDDSAAARVAELNSKADKSDLDDYFKLDGTKAMTGNLNMNNNRIHKLPDPQLADEPVTRKFLTQTNTLFYNIFLDLDGNAQMRGNIKMNNNHITGLTNPPNADDEATNKKYVNDVISKANIKPSHTPKNAFKYLMDDVNEWSSEYNIKVLSFSDMTESPHSWNKRILNITPLKDDDNNYRFRLGIQCFSLENNKEYTLAIELYNKDYETWNKQSTFVNADTAWIESYHTQKFQHHYQENSDIYYTKTLIKFKKTSTSTPNFIYITYHFDDNGGDMSTYPKEFANQVYILAYGSKGLFNHLDSAVYDKHQAFEIDKTKMKMLVPLDLNNKKIINISNDSDVTKINLYGMVDKRRFFTAFTIPIEFNKVRIVNIKLLNTLKTRLKKDVINFYITSSSIIKYPFTFPDHPTYIYIYTNKQIFQCHSLHQISKYS